ncbi:MAG: hypothetical protein D6714_12605 [Bacteroidetes bacterium]|nr:MAG: hypothetical protein D6714_12605 [Bacteroidota bacterium]
MMLKYSSLALLFLLNITCLKAQKLTAIATKWSDSFREWTIYTDEEDLEGELRMRWQMQNDWSEWDFSIGDLDGTIRLKWKDNPNTWELRANGQIITARTLAPNDFRQWRITNDDIQFKFKSKWGQVLEEWAMVESNFGEFAIYTYYEGDPRDWEIIDNTTTEITLPMRVMMTFLAVFHGSPKV